MDTYKLIVNPAANKGTGREAIPEIEAGLKKNSVRYELILTERPGHAQELAAQEGSAGYTGVIAVGGDGTVNEVINGLMLLKQRRSSIPLFGVIPTGRGNDFAYSARIPVDLERACRILGAGQHVPMDVGKVTGGFFPGGRYFVNGVGIGFDTIVGLEAAKMKHLHSFSAYIAGALKTLIFFPAAPRINITYDEKNITQQSTQISIMNGRRMGGIFHMAPEASLNDGKFNLLLADKLTRREFLALITHIIKGVPIENPKIKLDLLERIQITAPDGGLVGHVDGETVCTDGKDLNVECLPNQLELITGGL